MTVLLLAAVVVVLLFLPAGIKRNRQDAYAVRVVRDTVIKTVPAKPLVITKVKTHIVKLSDTVIRYHPFRATIDTVIMRDTIRSYFEFPAGLFSLSVKSPPDSLKVPRIIMYKTKREKEQWWEKPLMAAGCVLAGYVIGRVK